MSALAWTPFRDALIAEIATADGADVAIGNQILARLNHLGDFYDAVYTSEVDDDKDSVAAEYAAAIATWTTKATAKWTDAARTVYFAEDQTGLPGPSIPFNADSTSTLFTRLDAALASAVDVDTIALLTSYRAAVAHVFGTKPSLRIWGSLALIPSHLPGTMRARGYITVEALEDALQLQLDRAEEYLDALAYVPP